MAFVAGPHNVFHDAGDHQSYLDAGGQHHHHHHPHYANQSMHESAPSAFYNPNAVHPPHPMSCEIKPRLTKEQHDILESHYQKQNKPNTNTKKGFAESLNVSLDKVNNWFQNRRAKAKQDAKKQAGAYNLFAQQQASTASLSLSSDSESSPAFASPEYYSMMQQCSTADDQISNNMNMNNMSRFQDEQPNGLPFTSTDDQFSSGSMNQHLSADLFDTPQDLNRRTLTQEQFDAFAQNGGMIQPGPFDASQAFPPDADVLNQMFPDMQNGDFKTQDVYAFPAPIGAPLSSNDSTVPSTISEQSMFPTSASMQDQNLNSSTSSEWADSRSSSVSVAPSQDSSSYQQVSAAQQQPVITTSQWQPGQSIPVDPNDLQQQFREAAQRQAQQPQQQQQEQPLAWPSDEAFGRRDSQNGTMLAQQMSSFAIQTPQPPQSATFKCPAPPGEGNGGIAARRQRPRPAALGLASLRSQSYSGAVQPASPSHAAQNLAPGNQLRRIRSSNVINGVAQGRVMKSMPGSAQRSPLNWTFADSMNSPKAVRQASTSSANNLAPPTPMSPSEMPFPAQEQARPQFPPWQASNGHFSRQASISETDAEHSVPVMPNGQMSQQQNVSSPPHTPMYHHHHHQQYPQNFATGRVGNNAIIENTPPQSAPAVQQSFPADVFMMPPQHPTSTQQAPSYMSSQQPPHFVNAPVSEQHFQMANSFNSGQGFAVAPSDGQQQMHMQFANGVPMVNAQGQLTMAFPSQMQFVQQAPSQVQNLQPAQPQGGQYSFHAHSGSAPGMHSAQMPKQQTQPAAEFFVHEYTPPQEIKRSATQRKVPTDSGPKNYTFANQGPEHFEKEKAKKGQEAKNGTASSSPASASSGS